MTGAFVMASATMDRHLTCAAIYAGLKSLSIASPTEPWPLAVAAADFVKIKIVKAE